MLTKRAQSGFTVIEVTIALAIVALLGTMVVFGQNQARQRAQFSDGVEMAKNSIIKVKNEANTTVNDGGGTGGSNSNQIFWGKRIAFSDGSSTMAVQTLVLYKSASPCGQSICSVASTTVTLPWGVRYTSTGSTGDQIYLVRSQVNGALQIYAPLGAFSWQNPNSYDLSVSGLVSQKDFKLTDPNNFGASIKVDPSTGSITRVFN